MSQSDEIDEIDAIRDLLEARIRFRPSDVDIIRRMVRAMEDGSLGAFIVRHEGRIEYLFANGSRTDAIGLLLDTVQENNRRLRQEP